MRARVYSCTRNERSEVKNESRFEILILKGVDLGRYIFKIDQQEKKLVFELVVLKCPIFNGRVLGFILKIDHKLFRAFGLFLPNQQL